MALNLTAIKAVFKVLIGNAEKRVQPTATVSIFQMYDLMFVNAL